MIALAALGVGWLGVSILVSVTAGRSITLADRIEFGR